MHKKRVAYLETKRIDVYVRNSDRRRVVYICTISKLSANSKDATLISSRICSKVK